MSDLIRVTGLNSGMDTESIIKQLVAKYQKKVDNANKDKKAMELRQDKWKEMNTSIYSFYSTTLSNMRWSTSYTKMKTTSSSSALSVEAGSSAAAGIQSAKILATAKAGYLTSAKVDSDLTSNSLVAESLGLSGSYQFNGKTIEIDDETTVSGFMKKLSEAGVNANFDEKQHRFYISANSTGEANDLDLSQTDSSVLSALGLSTTYEVDEKGYYFDASGNKIDDEATIKKIQDGEVGVRVKGEDAKLMLNGTIYTSDSNAFEVNGLTLTINNYTEEEISINTKKDVSGIYDSIKNMFTQYNNMINSMLKAYNADTKKYKPLTDEEEDALTETELKKWQENLNESALGGNERLAELMRSMRSVFADGVDMGDGRKMYLADFGIATLGYFEAEADERYAYHIDGDETDPASMGNKDKLKSMIATDPETVQKFFSTLSNNLYKQLGKEMASSEMSSIYKVYNDKQLEKDLKNQDSLIKKYEQQMSKAEDKYYDQFARMETALAKLQSKQGAISSYLGG